MLSSSPRFFTATSPKCAFVSAPGGWGPGFPFPREQPTLISRAIDAAYWRKTQRRGQKRWKDEKKGKDENRRCAMKKKWTTEVPDDPKGSILISPDAPFGGGVIIWTWNMKGFPFNMLAVRWRANNESGGWRERFLYSDAPLCRGGVGGTFKSG